MIASNSNNDSQNTSTEHDGIFSMILASTVHDMKNALGMLNESLNVIVDSVSAHESEAPQDKTGIDRAKHIGVVQYESSRVNNSLMQLLAIYKLENEQLPFSPTYHNVYDFLEEQMLMHTPLLDAKGIQCELDVEEELEFVFDDNLMGVVLENIVGNAIRYTHSKIKLSAELSNVLTIRVEDDGPGYPKTMIQNAGAYITGLNQSTGSTGMGLYFAQQIAFLHKHNDSNGQIELRNGGAFSGGVFEISLP